MLLRGFDGNRDFENNGNQNYNIQRQNESAHQFNSKIVEELIETSLEHFAHEDATLLAETYHYRVGSERSLLILAHCLTRNRSFENAYHLLKTEGNSAAGASLKTAKCRCMFAYCAFTLNRLQEAENTLRDPVVQDRIQLHPSFVGSASLPYAHSLLANILCETNRVDSARAQWAESLCQNPMLWTSIRSYCEVGGEALTELLQPFLNELSHWRILNSSAKVKEGKNREMAGMEQQKEDMVEGRITPTRTPSRTRCRITSTPTTAERRRRLRNQNQGSTPSAEIRYNSTGAAAFALRASENSPLTRANKINAAGMGAPLIEQQEDKPEHQEQVNKRTTRRTTAMAAAVKSQTANKDAETEMQRLINQQMHQDQKIYYELLDWLMQLAQVQQRLSRFHCTDALQLLNALSPSLSQFSLSLELRARVFFEHGEYRRACEIFEEIRRLYPRRVQGMEIYSTALWQLHDPKKLSALAAEMTEMAREQSQTWCIAGNCFSLEKQHEIAIECLERSIRLNHRFGYAYSLLGHELIDMNDLTRAEQAFRKAIVYSPNDYRAWYGLGLVNFKEEKLHLARVNLQRAVQINPTNTVLLCQLAVIEQALHCNESAMQFLEKALKYQPNNVPCRFHKARLLFDTGHYERAKTELEELKVLSPDEAHVFFLLGRVNRKLGNTHMALLNFSWATEIDPRGEQNQSALTTDKGPYDDEPIE